MSYCPECGYGDCGCVERYDNRDDYLWARQVGREWAREKAAQERFERDYFYDPDREDDEREQREFNRRMTEVARIADQVPDAPRRNAWHCFKWPYHLNMAEAAALLSQASALTDNPNALAVQVLHGLVASRLHNGAIAVLFIPLGRLVVLSHRPNDPNDPDTVVLGPIWDMARTALADNNVGTIARWRKEWECRRS